ncbi:MAG: HDOD domain-containing protein [Ideonella sp.]|nr:HDOD domain-containing protein [Ideonella sp.]
MLHLPRVRPVDGAALEAWLHQARLGARLHHPNLAPATEIGVHDQWPYVAVERGLGVTLAEWLQARPRAPHAELIGLACQALEGLAFAHEAGAVHQDLQLHHLLVDERGQLRVAALDIVVESTLAETAFGALAETFGHANASQPPRGADEAKGRLGGAFALEPGLPLASVLDPGHLRARREGAERDVLCVGLLLHQLLAGAPALDEADTGRVVARLPPQGRETVRLPWSTTQPVAEALRAIVNRATDRQPRQRYLAARSLLRALDGWRTAAAEGGGGPLALLLDRLHGVGHLPALPGVGLLAARLTKLEARHATETSERILRDLALSFELLRQVNSAQVRGTQVAGNGPVLTMRRCLALVGVKGVRQAVAALRAWPGPLGEADAAALKQCMDRVRLAGHTAQALRPAGYDGEAVYLIAALQNLGRLLVQYHFGHDAAQIAALMQPIDAGDTDLGAPGTGPPGRPRGEHRRAEHEGAPMTEEGAAFAVLGVDLETLGIAVARHWGLADDVVHMIRRLSPQRPVRQPEGDADLLRLVASAANEAVDAITQLDADRAGAALQTIVQRYGRGLGLTLRELERALQQGRQALQGRQPAAASTATLPTDSVESAATDPG